jgi:putative NADH-flavin reductase
MHLAIFGATGRTGKLLVEQALESGFVVKAFVRDPLKMTIAHPRLRVVEGDATDPAAVRRVVEGADAVLSVLATSASQTIAKERPLTRGTRNILAAMKEFGVRRIVISASGIPQEGDAPDPRFHLLMGFVRRVVRASYEDTVGSAQAVRESSLDWTIVRMAAPTNGPRTGRVRAGFAGRSIGMRIARADAAAFMLEEVRTARFVRQAPVICSQST